MEGTQEAEMIVRFAMDGVMQTVKLAGSATKHIVAMLAALSKQPDTSPGKKRMAAMLKSGEAIDYYSVPESKIKEFAELAKSYGIQYAVMFNQDGCYDLAVKVSDSARINRIGEIIGLGEVHGVIEPSDKTEQAIPLTKAQELLMDIRSKNPLEDIQKGNPNQELVESSPSYSSSNNTKSPSRPSVTATIESYKNDIESTQDMFAAARSLRENVMSDSDISFDFDMPGWIRPSERMNESGELLHRGKTVEQMDALDQMQYLVDQEMSKNGKLSEPFIEQLYMSGWQVDTNGIVSQMQSHLDNREKRMMADMMRQSSIGEKIMEFRGKGE